VDVQNGLTPESLAECCREADALILRSATRVTADLLAAAPKLKVVGRAGVGVDNVDLEAATARGVVVMNTPGGNAVSAAEHTLSLLLSLAKHIPQATASMRAGRWEKGKFVSTEVSGKTLGLIGLGRIGGEVAKRAKGLNLRVIVYDPSSVRSAPRPWESSSWSWRTSSGRRTSSACTPPSRRRRPT